MLKPPRVGVFHPGTQHSWQSALAFQESDQLAWYATSVFYDPDRWPYRIERWLPLGLGDKVGREFRRRYTPLLNPNLVRTFGFDEWLETAAQRSGWPGLSKFFNRRGNSRFGHDVIRLIEREPVDVVWGFNSSSLEVFRWAKRRGLTCVLDQTVGHPNTFNRVIAEEQLRHPDYFLDFKLPCDSAWIDRENEEVELADLVVVGSEACYRSMVENGCPIQKLKILPYGFDESIFSDLPPKRPLLRDRPVEFLFVGALHPRKGIAYLLEAFESIDRNRAFLTLIGSMAIPDSAFKRYAPHVAHIPQLPRPDVVRHFRNADVFIFPSLFEGSALVLYEAIGAGLGIIQSNASGIGVEADESNGICLPEVSASTVRSAIDATIGNQNKLEQWSTVSWNMRNTRSWRAYRERVRGLVQP